MRMFSACSGECCVCSCGGFCLAGHGDDDYWPASTEQIIERLEKGQYPDYRAVMINELKRRGIIKDWIQPIVFHQAYKQGEIVSFNGELRRSLINDNIWPPYRSNVWEPVDIVRKGNL